MCIFTAPESHLPKVFAFLQSSGWTELASEMSTIIDEDGEFKHKFVEYRGRLLHRLVLHPPTRVCLSSFIQLSEFLKSF